MSSIIARSAFRSAAPLKRSTQQAFQSKRAYASGPSSSGGLGTFGWVAIAAVAGGGGYYYYANVQGKAPPLPVKGQKSGAPSGKSSGPATSTFTGGEQGFIPLKLENVEEITHNTKRFIFGLPSDEHDSGLTVASALLTKFQNEGEKPVIRPYTPVSAPGKLYDGYPLTSAEERGKLELIIKRYPNGPMSEHIHSMKPGQSLEFKGPLPKYTYEANKHKHVSMICGGTGITPMWQVIQRIFNDPSDKTKVTLVFGNLTAEDIILKSEFDHLENTYPQRFRAFYTLDQPPENWPMGKGHITKDLLKTVLPEPKEPNTQIFVCGPPGLYKAISGAKKSPSDQGDLAGVLKELGYSKEQVYKF